MKLIEIEQQQASFDWWKLEMNLYVLLHGMDQIEFSRWGKDVNVKVQNNLY